MPISAFGRARSRVSSCGTALAASTAVAGMLLTGLTVPAEAATTYKAPLRTAVKSLPVATESNTGYDRDKSFGDWKDANGDCQNTRAEVLDTERKAAVSYTTTKRCTGRSGKWVPSWDNRTHTAASTLQIDHTVPVHEAWGSGAKNWTQAKRVSFYNDLGDSRTLNAQTSKLNSSKGARGPEQSLPPKNRCTYFTQWVAVKIRWGLKADSTEKAALTKLANAFPNTTLTVTKA